MKAVFSISLCLLLLAQSMSLLLYKQLYQLNKQAITEAWCVNKNNKELKCEGKCHLKKQIEKRHEEEKNNQQERNELVQLCWLATAATFEFKEPVVSIRKCYPANEENHNCQYTYGIFHPPKQV